MNSSKVDSLIKNLIIDVTNILITQEDILEDDDLFSTKILDSITFVKLVNKLEIVFNIEFTIAELTTENFRSVKLMRDSIREKLIMSGEVEN